MVCFHPLKGFRAADGSGRIVFNPGAGYCDLPLSVSCGQCVGCRLERSRQWAVRCLHEASLHADNCFITLTYSDEFLPADGSLNLRHFQLFMKRLRKKYGAGIRFYHCGEYGEQFGRPHYHACIFGFDFADKELWRNGGSGEALYRSEALEALWPFGHSSIGEVTFKSAAYVARYIMKKMNGDLASCYYEFVDRDGVVYDRTPDYTTMSRRPGIGAAWIGKFTSDVYPDDFVIVNGKKCRPPRFYDCAFEVEFPSDFARLKGSRVRNSKRHAENNTPARLKVREYIAGRKLELLKREL